MAKRKEVRAEFKDGEVTISVRGVSGKACKDLTKTFEDAIGTTISSVETPEMRERPMQQEHGVRQTN